MIPPIYGQLNELGVLELSENPIVSPPQICNPSGRDLLLLTHPSTVAPFQLRGDPAVPPAVVAIGGDEALGPLSHEFGHVRLGARWGLAVGAVF